MVDSSGSLFHKTSIEIQNAVNSDTQNRHAEAIGHYINAVKSISEMSRNCDAAQRYALKAKYDEYSSRAGELLCQMFSSNTHNTLIKVACEEILKARMQYAANDIKSATNSYIDGLCHIQNIIDSTKTKEQLPDDSIDEQLTRELRRFFKLILEEAENIKKQLTMDSGERCHQRITDSIEDNVHDKGKMDISDTDIASQSLLPLESQTPELPGANTDGYDNFSENTNIGTSNSGSKYSHSYNTPSLLPISQPSKSLNLPQCPSSSPQLNPSPKDTDTPKALCRHLSELSVDPKKREDSRKHQRSKQIPSLSTAELEVIKITSHVSGLTFLPWVDSDFDEKFVLQEHFTDRDGLLSLSSKQQRRLSKWQRASRIYAKPKIFDQIGCEHIVQETVTDCSFVAALCVSVEYERKFGRQLITRHIFPQDSLGRPTFNPCGKYMVKLQINGLWRRVVVDDQLPVGEDGRLVCTYSTVGDVGPSLIEKAYLKTMGGYDFPGSNSSTDLYTLTGWIPEHVFIHSQSFIPDRTWERIRDGSRNGDVLLTVATGEMSTSLANSLGLVPSHAYAVLDVREVDGKRLLKVKNPWSSHCWMGTYSHMDRESWTPELRQKLGYDPDISMANDGGIFWIDYESVCHRFDSIHLNWNPDLFAYYTEAHFEWSLSMGPRKVLYDFSTNPQYTLNVKSPHPGGADSENERALVCILLSKHIQKTEENKDFIALHVYSESNGQRVYESLSAMHISEYVNIPHTLVQFSADPSKSYTLVVAQREKTHTLYFTLRAFCDIPIELRPTPFQRYSETISGQWGSGSAGGNTTSPRYMDNPQYCLVIQDGQQQKWARTNGVITLEASHKYPVNLRLFRGGLLVTRVLEINTASNSGKYRSRYCACNLDNIEPGNYTLVASTFEPYMFSRFKITIGMDAPFTVSPIPREGAGMRLRELRGRWQPENVSVSTTEDVRFHIRSPRFLLSASKPTSILVRLQTPDADPLPLVNVSVCPFAKGAPGPSIASSGSYTNSPQGVATRLTDIKAGGEMQYLLVMSTWDRPADAAFVVYFYSEEVVEIEPIHDDY